MQITVEIPDRFAQQLAPGDRDPARMALEAMPLEAYRDRRISAHQLQQLLGIGSRYELDGFLKRHQVWLEYDTEDLQQDLTVAEQIRQAQDRDLPGEPVPQNR